MPKLKITVMKEKKPRPLRAPQVRKAPRQKKVNFNAMFGRSRRTSSGANDLGFFATLFLYTKLFLFLMIFLAVFTGIFGG